MIEGVCDAICYCLKIASVGSLPITKSNFFKFWWNDNLQTLKEESLAAHRLWIDCGKPRHGAVFEIAKKR